MTTSAVYSLLQPSWLLIACCVAFTSCAREDQAPEPAESEALVTAVTGAGVLVATLPERIGPALVQLQPRSGHQARPPTAVANIDQFGYTFDPALSIARQGQPVRFRNSEDVDHHVRVTHAETRAVVVNTNLLMDESVDYVFVEPGPYTVRCDVHPAMMALILVVAHPYAAVADKDGVFRLESIPSGFYDLTAWNVAGDPVVELDAEVSVDASGVQLTLNAVE